MSNNQSKCIYCGSTSYGSGCIFSSHRIHVHTDDPTRCTYCGMMSYGSGCIFNPFSNMHVHGIDVAQTIKETVRKTVELSYITDRLLKPITKSEAYKIKLIDKTGKLLRAPESVYEQNLVSPLSKLLYRLKRHMPEDVTPLVESLKLLSQLNNVNETAEQYKDRINFEAEIKPIISHLYSTIKLHNHKLSLEAIESSIENALLEEIC